MNSHFTLDRHDREHDAGLMSSTEQSARPPISVEGLVKRYGDVRALDDVSLDIAGGRFVTLLGPSGSGKTTLLMTIAGFSTPDAGRVLIGDRDITALPPEKRNFGMVFQGYALFPHLTVAGNVAFPLKLRGLSRAEIDTRVAAALEMVRLASFGDRYPRQLSGGQQQRVALARALVFEPEVLLLDEPLSALDKTLRADLQWELKELHNRLGMTFIYVTHDQEEALSMSDDIAIVRDGRIVQKGDPKTLYNQPATHFVAGFLGRSNFIDGVLRRGGGATELEAAGHRFAVAETGADGTAGVLAIRPEKLEIGLEQSTVHRNRIAGRLTGWNYYGSTVYCRFDTALGAFHAQFPTWQSTFELTAGANFWIEWPPEAGTLVADDRKPHAAIGNEPN